MQEFDFVIVGAGSAGCVLAARLSEDPKNRVCLIEAGPADRHPAIGVPFGVMHLFTHKTLNWRFKTVPQKHAAGREIYVPRGRVLGGSSTINGMVYTRGHPSDYDDWAALGNAGWSFQEVLPYFRRSENNEEHGVSPYHGSGGPLNVKYLDMYNPLCEVLFEAAEDMQYRRTDDFCGPTHEGFGRRQATMKDGRRWSASHAFLRPALKRPNLTVITSALVRRLTVAGGRATGVEYERDGRVEQVKATRDVVLSAGVIGSPQILMLSGIGPAAELKALGIDVVRDLHGVGKNYQDHVCTTVQYTSPTTVPYGISWKTLPWGAWSILQYLLFRRGIFANNMLHAGGFIRTLPELERPDLQFIFMPVFRDARGRMGIGHGFGLMPIVLRPESRGELRLASTDPHDAPLIDPNFLSASSDVETLLRGLKIARRLLNAPQFDPYRGEEANPGRAVESDEALVAYIRDTAFTAYHPVATCSMGPGPEAVVRADLKVHGIDGLRVADASIMPTLIGGNTNSAAIMVGEKAADMILGRPAPVPANVPVE
ncbi:MAG: choline dehydrogenase [Rhizobiaceae bacterium]|nr:choline dehydrogenase [Rhizobiaceae bacterium]